MADIQELADRVERLLLRHQELQRTHSLLQQQLEGVTRERDNLRSRLNAARQRIDVLLDRLPQEPAARAPDAQAPTPRQASVRSALGADEKPPVALDGTGNPASP